MLGEIPWYKFREWHAYAEIEPFGEEREDKRAAYIVRAMWNMMRDTKTQREPYGLATFEQDFLVEIKEIEKPRKTPKQLMSQLFEALYAQTPAGQAGVPGGVIKRDSSTGQVIP